MEQSTNTRLPEPLSLTHILQMLTERSVQKTSQPAVFYVKPDLTQGIRSFDGDNESDKLASEWIENINTTAVLHQWPDTFKLQTAKQRLKGPARDWLLGRLEVLSTWQKFETNFHETFTLTESLVQRFVRMQACTQKREQSKVAYFHKKMRLCRAVNLDFADCKEQLIIGL